MQQLAHSFCIISFISCCIAPKTATEVNPIAMGRTNCSVSVLASGGHANEKVDL